jgi:peptide/nickel transport system substrate-binding protein
VPSLDWSIPGDPVAIDPIFAYDFSTLPVVSQVVDSLMKFGPTGQVEPWLAERVDVPKSTELVYTLRKNVMFHDGTEMTSADAVASLKRQADPQLGGYLGGYYANVIDIVASGPYEVTVRFKQPDYAFPNMMASAAGGILSKKFIDAHRNDLGKPSVGVVGAGPYKFVSWQSGQQVVVERFDDYWNRDVDAKVKRAVYPIIEDAQTMLSGLQTGQVSGTMAVTGSQLSTLSGFSNVNLLRAEGFGYTGAAFNMLKTEGPFADPRARRALFMATDRKGILNAAEGGAGIVAEALVPPPLWSYEKATFEKAYKALPQVETDPEGAKKLAEEVGLSGSSATLIYNSDEMPAKIQALGVQSAAQAIGVNIELSPLQATQFYDSLNRGQERKGDWDLAILLWIPDFADPLVTYYQMTSHNPANSTGYHNAAFDRAAKAGGEQVTDESARARFTVEAQAHAMQDLPIFPIYTPDSLLAMESNLALSELTLSPVFFSESWLAHISGVAS